MRPSFHLKTALPKICKNRFIGEGVATGTALFYGQNHTELIALVSTWIEFSQFNATHTPTYTHIHTHTVWMDGCKSH